MSETGQSTSTPEAQNKNTESGTPVTNINNNNSTDTKKVETITIRVKDQSGEETFFKVKPHTKMEKIFTAYADRKGVPPTALRFLLDGVRIAADQTPKMLELEDQDQIDCALEQVGGYFI